MARTYTVTKEQLYRAACTRSQVCDAHKQTVDRMIERLEADGSDS